MSPELWSAFCEVAAHMQESGLVDEARVMRAHAIMVLGSPWDHPDADNPFD